MLIHSKHYFTADDNISEDSVSTLGMGGYEDGVQHENFSSTIEQPMTHAAPKKKKTNGGKESRYCFLRQSYDTHSTKKTRFFFLL